MQGGHPYKADAAKLLSQTSKDMQVRHHVSRRVLDQRTKLSPECKTALEANPEDLELIKQALTELSKQ